MKPNLFRQLRLVVILVAGIGVITTMVALAVAYWSEMLQRDFLDTLAHDEYQELLEHLEQHPGTPLPKASQLEIWMDGHPDSDKLPDSLRPLSVGTHHDVVLDEQVYHVLKTETEGYPTYVAIETSGLSNRERWLQAALIGVALLDIPLALLMGIWLVRRISIPHENLARSVSELDPEKGTMPIGKQFLGLEVEKIANAVDQYQERLGGFVERERTFTAAASHELRTPLTAILTTAELMEHDPQLPTSLQAHTRRLIETSFQMSEILDGLMLFSRETEQLDKRLMYVEPTLREITSHFPNNEIQIHVEEFTHNEIMAPAGLFTIVISNLIRNACQFSANNSIVHILLNRDTIQIRNSGTPIPQDQISQIFQRNVRSMDSPGQGLGLYIVSRVCKRLDWPLTVASNESGTVVTVKVS